jgi:hypothetical protein
MIIGWIRPLTKIKVPFVKNSTTMRMKKVGFYIPRRMGEEELLLEP